jgi:hypothetical protein
MTRITHKQHVPLTAKKWSIRSEDLALLKFGFFWEIVKKYPVECKCVVEEAKQK